MIVVVTFWSIITEAPGLKVFGAAAEIEKAPVIRLVVVVNDSEPTKFSTTDPGSAVPAISVSVKVVRNGADGTS